MKPRHHNRRSATLSLAFLMVTCLCVADSLRAPIDGPLSAEQALASFRLEPGLRVELVAAEPTIADPVAMAFDERGRMFVAEDRGYPTGPGEGKPLAGIIAMLEDTRGDG